MKRILLVTYYFPPCGGASVQRWLRFLPELVKRDFSITVLTTKDGDYPVRDETLLAAIPEDVKVVRTYTPIFGKYWKFVTNSKEPIPYGSLNRKSEASVLKKVMYWVRLNLVIPDARAIWNHFAFKKATELLEKNHFDLMITTGPPHSTHLIGKKIKQKFGIKWIADFRDPWTKIFYLAMEKQNPISKKIDLYLEKKVVGLADLNMIISKGIANQLPQGKKVVFYNGFNKNDFAGLHYSRTELFRIKYIGQLTAGQDIQPLLQYLNCKISESSIKDVSFSFVGTQVNSIKLSAIISEAMSFLPHKSSLNEMVNCELLILLINEYTENKGMLTTKLFEYIGSRTPILCIGPLDGEAATIISDAAAGKMFEMINEHVWFYFYEIYQKWRIGKSQRNDDDISQWSVQHQIIHLEQLINSISSN